MELNVIEMFVDERDEEQGINAVSIVTDPAIESFPVFLKNQKRVKLAEVDKERQILMGALLIPDKLIFRRDEESGEEYYIHFGKETVRKALSVMMKRGKLNNTTEEHEVELEGNTVVEAWIKEDMKKDKSALYGLNDPVGSLMISLHIADKKKYKEYKKNGMAFSLEGFFSDKVKMKKVDSKNLTKEEKKRIYIIEPEKMSFYDKIKALVLSEEVKLEEMKTESGVVLYADAFEPGNAVYVLDEENERMKAPEGEIPLEGGQSLVVDAEGMIVSIGEPEQVQPEEEQEMEQEKTAKKVVETTSKETHFEKEGETVEVIFTDAHKEAIKDLFNAWYNEKLSATEETTEEVEQTTETVEEVEASKVKPIRHSTEKKKGEMQFNFKANRPNRQEQINKFLFG